MLGELQGAEADVERAIERWVALEELAAKPALQNRDDA
jgi:hypothetical protein